jgi:hypothetical protein
MHNAFESERKSRNLQPLNVFNGCINLCHTRRKLFTRWEIANEFDFFVVLKNDGGTTSHNESKRASGLLGFDGQKFNFFKVNS